jgi:nucleotide-binding universal stress UspA family protein
MFSEHALPLGLAIARLSGAALRIARVHVPFIGPIEDLGGVVDRAAREEAQAYLTRVVQRLRDATPVRIESALLEVPVAEALCEHAKKTDTDLIVMTTHGRGPLVRSWLGSIADELVRRTPVPVLLARPQETKPDLGQAPNFQRVLVPLDGSAFAEQVLEPAIEFGALTLAEYVLARVIEPMIRGDGDLASRITDPAAQGFVERLQVLHDENRAAANAYVEQVAQRLRSRALRVQTRVVVGEQPAMALLDVAKEEHCDLIAIGTHGRRGLSRLFLGSVADKILRGASAPVLIHRPVSTEEKK